MGKMPKGYLILENGQIFEGISVGYERDIDGEVVFNTGMVGYPESFTDPSYFGQILVMTYPLIGNYGVPIDQNKGKIDKFWESDKIQIRGLVLSNYITNNSHWQAVMPLHRWITNQRIGCLTGIDTRSLTQILREFGVMKGKITFQPPPKNIGGVSFHDINQDNLVAQVSINKICYYGKGKLKILVIDCGLKLNQLRLLLKYDTTLIRVPWNYNPFNQKTLIDFDGIFISNGPGDPKTVIETVATLREALKRRIPILGICLGNQILALACGADTYKLKYGHRSQNQPVKDEISGKCFITSQNHGYAVDTDSIPNAWQRWFTNLNDATNEGIRHRKLPFLSCQFHPEAAPGPTDTQWIFDYFIKLTTGWKNQRKV